jgi:F0F1-type ATP synthase assembly protein I
MIVCYHSGYYTVERKTKGGTIVEHVKALVIKFIMITAVLGIVLTGIYDVAFGDTLLISLVLTVLAYVSGDMLILRKSGEPSEFGKRNMIATISDAVLSFLVIWLMGEALFTGDDGLMTAALISTILIGAGEWFFHRYVEDHVFHQHAGGEGTY